MVTDREAASEIDTVLNSASFVRARELRKVLKFICEQRLRGDVAQITEYNIGTRSLGRRSDFCPANDSIVRVHAARLRKHLQEYYERDGASHHVQIRLPAVGYVPEFVCIAPPLSHLPNEEPIPPQDQPAIESPRRIEAPPAKPWIALRLTKSQAILAAIAVVVLSAAALGMRIFGGRERSFPAVAPPPLAVSGYGEPGVRIRSGKPGQRFLDANGNGWLDDRYFTGGVAFERPDRAIFRTFDQSLYQNGREGSFSYTVPVRPGTYEVHLHFAETYFGYPVEGADTQRKFDVAINGVTVLSSFDIASDSAGSNVADEKVFTDILPAHDGFIRLSFTSAAGRALLNGIEILPGVPGMLQPIRISCSARPSVDGSGRVWTADRCFSGGRLFPLRVPVRDGEQQLLFTAYRQGNFSYAIPVPEGVYRARFVFVEPVGFPSRASKESVGQRTFDVYGNGRALLTDFDIAKEAGRSPPIIEKLFRRLRPNAQGKLVFSFVPVKSYAVITAIEVTDERIPLAAPRQLWIATPPAK